ncbi:beta-propeller domain-containing protein [Aeromicrobium sp. 9AM]|uniref:beta-propeller domain-containing protein n=1 Tax=Aeromicrobium sp. 9AM TaxID=2653126 RepID=UPI0012F3AA14|nr:beta-propeller domain-containing protein [Aeromicrobium sp. 9AM]VXC16130.1 conserved hypothetical protein [Aeromicrobium sp. 9AM]
MSKLEDLWDGTPTGKPPVDAILAAGRAEAARRRKLRQTVLAVGATAAVVGAFVAGAAVGNGPGPHVSASRSDASPAAFQADLKPAQSCAQLLESYRDRGLGIVTAWGWGFGDRRETYKAEDLGADLAEQAAPERTSSGQRSQTSSETGTNVQETGVDEPDTVKTDGDLVVRLRGRDLVVYDATGPTMVKRATLNLPRLEDGELLLSGSRVVAIGSDAVSPRDELTGARRGSRVIAVSLADPADPRITSTVTYSSRVLSARQHASSVRLVLAAGLPTLDFVQPGGKVSEREALAANRRAVEKSTIKDWLPSYDVGDGSEQLLECTNVAVPPDSAGLDTVSIVGFTAKEPTRPHAIGLAGATTIAYESADHLYLADSQTPWGCGRCMLDSRMEPFAPPKGAGTTHLYDFTLDGIDAVHVASGEVEGTIADRWSLDEADDVLRVAVGPSSETGNFNSVVTFRREGKELTEIGRLDGLGRDEELKGVRWFDGLAVLVTYRETDPLFTVDLADPAKPRLLGELKIPGYSDYLHPLSDAWMLGIGDGGGGSGAQIGLFNTADLTNVRRTAVESYPGAYALASQDPRSFTWLPLRDTALTVIQHEGQVKLVVLKVTHGRLSSKVRTVEYGDDAAQVRTLGLPDGRVVLVTGEDVRFLDLP